MKSMRVCMRCVLPILILMGGVLLSACRSGLEVKVERYEGDLILHPDARAQRMEAITRSAVGSLLSYLVETGQSAETLSSQCKSTEPDTIRFREAAMGAADVLLWLALQPGNEYQPSGVSDEVNQLAQKRFVLMVRNQLAARVKASGQGGTSESIPYATKVDTLATWSHRWSSLLGAATQLKSSTKLGSLGEELANGVRDGSLQAADLQTGNSTSGTVTMTVHHRTIEIELDTDQNTIQTLVTLLGAVQDPDNGTVLRKYFGLNGTGALSVPEIQHALGLLAHHSTLLSLTPRTDEVARARLMATFAEQLFALRAHLEDRNPDIKSYAERFSAYVDKRRRVEQTRAAWDATWEQPYMARPFLHDNGIESKQVVFRMWQFAMGYHQRISSLANLALRDANNRAVQPSPPDGTRRDQFTRHQRDTEWRAILEARRKVAQAIAAGVITTDGRPVTVKKLDDTDLDLLRATIEDSLRKTLTLNERRGDLSGANGEETEKVVRTHLQTKVFEEHGLVVKRLPEGSELTELKKSLDNSDRLSPDVIDGWRKYFHVDGDPRGVREMSAAEVTEIRQLLTSLWDENGRPVRPVPPPATLDSLGTTPAKLWKSSPGKDKVGDAGKWSTHAPFLQSSLTALLTRANSVDMQLLMEAREAMRFLREEEAPYISVQSIGDYLSFDTAAAEAYGLNYRPWKEVTTVRVSAGANADYVVMRDHNGNWQVKATNNDPTELINFLHSSALASMNIILDASSGGSTAFKDALQSQIGDVVNQAKQGRINPWAMDNLFKVVKSEHDTALAESDGRISGDTGLKKQWETTKSIHQSAATDEAKKQAYTKARADYLAELEARERVIQNYEQFMGLMHLALSSVQSGRESAVPAPAGD